MRFFNPPKEIVDTVSAIIEDVRNRKEEALRELTIKYDGWDPGSSFEIPKAQLEKAFESLPLEDRKVLELAKKRIEEFHKRQVENPYVICEEGAILGIRVIPLEKVAVYVPGGRTAYPSTVLMNVIPARIAGVKEIIMVSPTPKGYKNPYVLAAAYMCEVDRVFAIGGAQAVAACAFGTETIPKVDKIVGPGNIYVAEAKRQLFGVVGIDSVAGPSEIVVVADDKANPSWIAADLLSQAEHDPMARSILITTSKEIADKVVVCIEEQLEELPTKDIASASWKNNGKVFVVKDIDEAISLVNEIAPEHLELYIENPFSVLNRIKNAGAVFLGAFTPEALGDYIAGPNHTLPTGSTARFSSPLGVYDFVKKSSFMYFDKKAFDKIANAAARFAHIEELFAHKRSIEIRQEGEGK